MADVQPAELLHSWRGDCIRAEKAISKLKGNEIKLQKGFQVIFRNCAMQMTMFVIIVSGIAFLVNSRFLTKQCWAMSLGLLLTLIFVLGIAVPLFLAFYSFKRLEDDVENCVIKRNRVKDTARGLVTRYDELTTSNPALLESAGAGDDKQRAKRMKVVRDSLQFAEVQQALYMTLTLFAALISLIYAIAFPVMVYKLIC